MGTLSDTYAWESLQKALQEKKGGDGNRFTSVRNIGPSDHKGVRSGARAFLQTIVGKGSQAGGNSNYHNDLKTTKKRDIYPWGKKRRGERTPEITTLLSGKRHL